MLGRHLSHKIARDQPGSSDYPLGLPPGTSGSAVRHALSVIGRQLRLNPTPGRPPGDVIRHRRAVGGLVVKPSGSCRTWVSVGGRRARWRG
jgi:hypothetical protein